MPRMNRREALKTTSTLLGGVAAATTGVLAACDRPASREKSAADSGAATARVLGAEDQALVEEVADTLLPTTAASPGARAAGAGAAINLLVSDCYDEPAQQKLVKGLEDLRSRCRDRCPRGFAAMAPSEREKLLGELDAEAQKDPEHWFHLARELSERAFFSSEVGLTKALRWLPVPGRWEGCVPLRPGQPAWA